MAITVSVCGEESITAKSYKFARDAEVDNNNNLGQNEGHLKKSVQAVPGHPQRKKSRHNIDSAI
jgi:hypothetical protein